MSGKEFRQNQMFGNIILPGQGLLGGKSSGSQNFGSLINNQGQILGQEMKQAYKMNLQGWNGQDHMSGLS